MLLDSVQTQIFCGAGESSLSRQDNEWGIVDVAFNLHRGDLSFRATRGERRGRVIHYCNMVLLRDAQFRVLRAGHEKAVRTGCRNIHAFVRGEVINDLHEIKSCLEWTRIHYNPFVSDKFTTDQSYQPLDHAEYVLLLNQRMYGIGLL